MDVPRCPLCGRRPERDGAGRLDCSQGHRFAEPDLWRAARMMQLTAEIEQFLDPDSAPGCPAHRWEVTEVRGEFVVAECAFCATLAVAVRDRPGA